MESIAYNRISIYFREFLEKMTVYSRFNKIKKSLLKDPLKKYNVDIEDLFTINKEKLSKGLNVKRLFADYIKTEFNLEVDETIYDIAKYYFESLRYERFIEIENAIYIMLLFRRTKIINL